MDVSSPALWMPIAISNSASEKFQVTELHQTELIVIRLPKADVWQVTFCPAVASVLSLAVLVTVQSEMMLWSSAGICFSNIMGENVVI